MILDGRKLFEGYGNRWIRHMSTSSCTLLVPGVFLDSSLSYPPSSLMRDSTADSEVKVDLSNSSDGLLRWHVRKLKDLPNSQQQAISERASSRAVFDRKLLPNMTRS